MNRTLTTNRAERGYIHAAKAYGHPRKKGGKRAASKARRRFDAAIVRVAAEDPR